MFLFGGVVGFGFFVSLVLLYLCFVLSMFRVVVDWFGFCVFDFSFALMLVVICCMFCLDTGWVD